MKILLIDNNPQFIEETSLFMQARDIQVDIAPDRKRAEAKIEAGDYDAIFLSAELENAVTLDLVRQVFDDQPGTPVVLSSEEEDEALNEALSDFDDDALFYFVRPLERLEFDKLLERLQRQVERRAHSKPRPKAQGSTDDAISFETEEESVRKTYEMALKAARTDSNMILTGPSGTGKTVLARLVHDNSARRDGPFVTVHCPSLSGELLESELFGHVKGAFTGAHKDTWGRVRQARRGTLFLDEISDLSSRIQAKLLRLLQSGHYERVGETETRQADVRIITATNQDIAAEVEAGSFREDLYYRLNVVTLSLPALEDRPMDIVPMAERMFQNLRERMGSSVRSMSQDFKKGLQQYNWPGNFRELRNTIERALIFSENEDLQAEDLPAFIRKPENPLEPRVGQPVSLEDLEAAHIRKILDREETIKDAAEVLGIDTATLYRKRKRMEEEVARQAGETTTEPPSGPKTNEVEEEEEEEEEGSKSTYSPTSA